VAVKTAGARICDSSEHFWETGEFTLTVTNADGLTLFSLMFVGTEAAAIGLVTTRGKATGEAAACALQSQADGERHGDAVAKVGSGGNHRDVHFEIVQAPLP